MAILTGTLLVLLSWAVILGAAVAVGLLPALGTVGGRWKPIVPRFALWWGLALLTVAIVSVGLALPLRSGAAALVIASVVGVMGAAGAWAAHLAGWRRVRRSRRLQGWQWVLMGGLALAVLYLAVAALGPVTNYDSGLYHLGAIAYAGDYRAIPGLANLYFPLGYANAHFPVAALLGNGPWDGIGYRLLNGGLLAAMAVDLWLRSRSRRLGPGFFVLAVGAAATLVPMVALSDYWVTSPTSDSAVLVLSVVSAAYLADAAAAPRLAAASGSVAIVLAVMAVLLRPTMAVYAAVTLAVAVLLIRRARRSGRRTGSTGALLLVGAFAAVAATVITARDVILSGWLQYPLSVVAFDVPWRAADPTQYRVPTLGAARDPGNLWEAAEGWGWVPAWIGRLPSQWETFEFAALAVVALVLLVLAARAESGLRARALLLVLLPSLVAVLFWWVATPPSFRFIWGPLFCLGAVPAGWSLWRLARRRPRSPKAVDQVHWLAAVGVAVPVAAVVLVSAVARFDPSGLTEERSWDLGVSIPYAVAPVVVVPVQERALATGLTVLLPTDSDQCWLNYPLCTAQISDSVSLRGDGIQDGFLP
jgi:hypothetical protein